MKLPPRAASALLAVVLLVALARTAAAQSSHDAARRGVDEHEREVVDLLNAYRASRGLGAVVPTGLLDQIAHDHSADMAARGYFGHDTPEGRSPFDRMRDAGYEADAMGENLAAGRADARATFEQWRASPPHDAAMLDPEYRAIGIGRVAAPGTRYRYYWTLVFGAHVDPSVAEVARRDTAPRLAAAAAPRQPSRAPTPAAPRARAAAAPAARAPAVTAPRRAPSRTARTIQRVAQAARRVIVVDILRADLPDDARPRRR